MSETLFCADRMLTDAAVGPGAVIEDAAVLVRDGVIVAVGRPAALKVEAPQALVRSFPGRAILPGTVNVHNHSFQSLLRGFGDDLPFLQWRDRALYRFTPRILQPRGPGGTEGDLRQRGTYAGALFAFAEMALCGVTTV